MLPDSDPAVDAYMKHLTEVADGGGETRHDTKSSWTSLHMQIAEKRPLEHLQYCRLCRLRRPFLATESAKRGLFIPVVSLDDAARSGGWLEMIV